MVAETPEGMVPSRPIDHLRGTLLDSTPSWCPSARDPKKVEWVRNLKMTYPSVVLYCIVPDHILPEGTLPIE